MEAEVADPVSITKRGSLRFADGYILIQVDSTTFLKGPLAQSVRAADS
jgi:hypothetical protein